MSQLWSKGLPLDAAIHRFTVGDDPVTDRALLAHDCVGSAAHARTLHAAGLLGGEDLAALLVTLKHLHAEARAGRLSISREQEDAHTALEQALTARVGAAGKRIHLGRSRNDQVMVALRLWMRGAVVEVARNLVVLAAALEARAQRHADHALPGYTHLRRAMPSTYGQWLAGHAAGLIEELEAAQGVLARLDRSPAGAAAGFGVPLPLDRALTARLLGFSAVQVSPVDVINSRGRHEVALTGWLASIAGVLEKLHWDLALYSTEEFGFVRLPDAFTTGSSIMPQKRNPDVVELARARCRELRGYARLTEELASGLPSNYHRDLQLLKSPVVTAVTKALELIDVTRRVVEALEFDLERARAAVTPELFATAAAYARAEAGEPFRDAYQAVAAELAAGTFEPPALARAAALGAPGRLGLAELERSISREAHEWAELEAELEAVERTVFVTGDR
jgi:argininosuccinate lyase